MSRLRSALGPAAIVGGRDGYRLGDVAWTSTKRARCCGRPAGASTPASRRWRRSRSTRALDLVGDGTALTQEPYADWAEPARVEAGALVRQAWSVAAEAALATGDPATAVAVAGTAVAADATDESAGRLLMRALVASGEPARALAAYEQLRADLADELGVDPAPETRQLHQAILREERGPAEPATDGAAPAGPGWSLLAGRSGGRAGHACAPRWPRPPAGRAATVLIVGEAGIGKTRLADELVEQARALGATVLSARCYDAERSLFLQPFAELISRQLGRHVTGPGPAPAGRPGGGPGPPGARGGPARSGHQRAADAGSRPERDPRRPASPAGLRRRGRPAARTCATRRRSC